MHRLPSLSGQVKCQNYLFLSLGFEPDLIFELCYLSLFDEFFFNFLRQG
jgi:hypothetical protein